MPPRTIRKSEIIRRKNFDGIPGGAERIHAETLRNICAGCGKLAVNRIQTFVPLDELSRRPKMLEALHIRYGRKQAVPGSTNNVLGAVRLPVMTLKSGKVVRMDDIHTCSACTPAAQRAVAKGTPSWCLVDITMGPGPDKIIVAHG